MQVSQQCYSQLHVPLSRVILEASFSYHAADLSFCSERFSSFVCVLLVPSHQKQRPHSINQSIFTQDSFMDVILASYNSTLQHSYKLSEKITFSAQHISCDTCLCSVYEDTSSLYAGTTNTSSSNPHYQYFVSTARRI